MCTVGMMLLDILGGQVGDSLLDRWRVPGSVYVGEKTRLPACIPELILSPRKGKLSGSMFLIPDSRRNMVLGCYRERCGRCVMESRKG